MSVTGRDLVIERLGKTFGRHRALGDVSLRFTPGHVAAVLGPNGAGKSTLLGIVATLVAPTSGRVTLGEAVLDRLSPARAELGYVGHEPGLYGELDARSNLRFFARLYGVPHDGATLDAALARVGLASVGVHTPVRAFSRGMQQRLALARALLHAPPVLLFDEPSSALDPAGAAWLSERIAAERASGRLVVLVTHDLEAAAAVADHVVILRNGRVVADERRASGFSAPELRALYQDKTRARAA